MIDGRTATVLDGVEYAPGARFEVLAPCRLSGMVLERGGAYGGWTQHLQPGDVIECTGFGPGWGSDPGYGVEWTSEQARAAGASHCDLTPGSGGIWSFRPAPGTVRPLAAEVTT